MSHFVWDRIKAKRGIDSVQGQEVRFVDGSRETFDIVIAATGYHVDLPFLAPALRPLDGHRLDLFLRVIHPKCPSLYFVGMFNVAGGGNIRMMDDQAQWVTELVTGAMAPPDEATIRATMAQEQAFLRKHYPAAPRYALELDPVFYRGQLAREHQRARQRRPALATVTSAPLPSSKQGN
jgi:hypothetical protein